MFGVDLNVYAGNSFSLLYSVIWATNHLVVSCWIQTRPDVRLFLHYNSPMRLKCIQSRVVNPEGNISEPQSTETAGLLEACEVKTVGTDAQNKHLEHQWFSDWYWMKLWELWPQWGLISDFSPSTLHSDLPQTPWDHRDYICNSVSPSKQLYIRFSTRPAGESHSFSPYTRFFELTGLNRGFGSAARSSFAQTDR